jgi:hypothetical protein
MQEIADAAVAEMHTANLAHLEEPKLTIPKMIAIAFIKFHREIKKRNRALVEADFKALRAERIDDDWMSGGRVQGKREAEEEGPQIYTTDDDVLIAGGSINTTPEGDSGLPLAKRIISDPNPEVKAHVDAQQCHHTPSIPPRSTARGRNP